VLSEGRLPLSPAESEALARLVDTHAGQASITRRDAGNTGPLLVHIGDDSWHVDETGKATRQRKPAR
jgi:hypothetical protein